MSIRITGGTYRNLIIKVPFRDVRPTQDRVRLAFFSSIGDKIRNARFLDLFAGSGIMGLEAISRGAKEVAFVEISKRNCMVIRENLALLHQLEVKIEVLCMDAVNFLKNNSNRFDIIYADPPYEKEGVWQKKILSIFKSMHMLSPVPLFILEQSVRTPELFDSEQLVIETRRYGETKLMYIKPNINKL